MWIIQSWDDLGEDPGANLQERIRFGSGVFLRRGLESGEAQPLLRDPTLAFPLVRVSESIRGKSQTPFSLSTATYECTQFIHVTNEGKWSVSAHRNVNMTVETAKRSFGISLVHVRHTLKGWIPRTLVLLSGAKRRRFLPVERNGRHPKFLTLPLEGCSPREMKAHAWPCHSANLAISPPN